LQKEAATAATAKKGNGEKMNWKVLMLAVLLAVPVAFAAAPAWAAATQKPNATNATKPGVGVAVGPASVQPGFERVYGVLDALDARNISTQEIRAFVQAGEANTTNATRSRKIEIAREINERWREFRREAMRRLVSEKIAEGMARAENALGQLKTIRERMETRGLPTQGVDNAITHIERNMVRERNAATSAGQLSELKRIQWELQYAKMYVKRMLNRQEAPTYRELGQAEVDAAVQPFADSASQAAA